MSEMQEYTKLTTEAKRIWEETGRPYWQIEEEVFADFWSRNPDWSPEARRQRIEKYRTADLPDFDGDTSTNGVE